MNDHPAGGEVPSPAELAAEMRRLSQLVDAGVEHLAQAARRLAGAEHDYRRAKAQAWVQAPPGTVPEREAWVDGACAAKRQARDAAEAERLAALEALRSRRQQLSALQTIARAARSEADLARYGPDLGP